jgi:hypothetical protein
MNMRTVTLVMLLLVTVPAVACSPKGFDHIEHGENALIAKVGYVVGERYPSYERRVLDGEDPDSQEAWQERLLRIAVIDNLRGDDVDFLEAPAACGDPFPELFERVIVVQGRDGYLRVFPAERSEQALRRAVRGEAATASSDNGELDGQRETICIRFRLPVPPTSGLYLSVLNAIDAIRALPGVHAAVRTSRIDPSGEIKIFRKVGYGVDGFAEAIEQFGLEYDRVDIEGE